VATTTPPALRVTSPRGGEVDRGARHDGVSGDERSRVQRSGSDVDEPTTPFEQGHFIGLAVDGSFNVEQWRSHSGLDPDQQRLWWQSASASPIGAIALNFGPIRDPEMDAALNTIKTNPDPAARKAAAGQVNKCSDGSKGLGLAFAGRHQVNEMWCDNGKCE
jgi:hypothetical protein